MVNRYCRWSRDRKICDVVAMQINFPAERREVSDTCVEPKGEIECPPNVSH